MRSWVGLALLFGCLACGAARDDAAPARVVLIGIDGLSWDIVDELRAQGRLPHLDRLVADGARGVMAVPGKLSISPRLWTTIASGVQPKVHGVHDFWASAPDVAAKRVWEIADERGLTTGVLGYLVTWPPHKPTGFLVPGWLAQDERTIPEDLGFLKQLEALEHHREPLAPAQIERFRGAAERRGASDRTLALLVAALRARGDDAASPSERELLLRGMLIELSADVFCQLLDEQRPELAIFYQHHVDAVEHLYFAHYRPEAFPGFEPGEETEREAIPRIHESVDRAVGRIRECAGEGATLLLVSDHGQEPGRLGPSGFARIRTTALLRELGLVDDVYATNVGEGVFLRLRRPTDDRSRIRRALRSVVWEDDGQPALQVSDHEPAALVMRLRPALRPAAGFRIGERRHAFDDFVDASQRLSGTHTEEAVFLMAGPGVAAGTRLAKGRLLDVTPTVLALLGLPLGRDMPGRPRLDALTPAARTALVIEHVDSHGAPETLQAGAPRLDEATRQRLRKLGYLE